MVLRRLLQFLVLVSLLALLSPLVGAVIVLRLLSQWTTPPRIVEQKSSPGTLVQENFKSSTGQELSILPKP